MFRKQFLNSMAQSLKKKEMGSKNCSFIEFPKASELQGQVSSLTDQNFKLSEEVSYWKAKYKELFKKLTHSEQVKKELRKSLVDFKLSKPVSSKSLARKEEQIQRNYEQVLESIGIIHNQAKKLFSQREQRIAQAYDMKVSSLVQEEREKLKSYLDIDKDKEIQKLNLKVEGLGAKILYFEQLNESLINRNKSYKEKLIAYSTENEALLKRLSKSVQAKSGLSKGKFTTPSHVKNNSPGNFKSIELNLETKVMDFLQELKLLIFNVRNDTFVDEATQKIDKFVMSTFIETST